MHIIINTKHGTLLKIPSFVSWIIVVSLAYVGIHWLIHDAIWLGRKVGLLQEPPRMETN